MSREVTKFQWLRVLAIAVFAALAVGCSSGSDDDPAAIEDVSERNPGAVAGRVLIPADQVALLQERGFFARLAAFLAPRAEARLAGLTPAADLEVELVRLDESANAIEPPLQSTFTDGDGAYAFDALPEAGRLAIRAQALAEPLRAFVSGPRVDLTPASEAAVRRVTAELGDDVPLSNFTLPELAAIDGLVHGLPVDLGGLGLGAAVETLITAAEPLLAGLVTGFASDDVSAPPAGAYGAIEHTSVVRDPAGAGGFAGGIDLGAGIGSFRFEDDAGVTEGAFLPRELSLLEPDGRLRDVTGATDGSGDIVPGDDLGSAVHVANGGLLVVVDGEDSTREVAGIGAIDAARGLLVYPLGLTLGEGDAPAAAGHGLRIAARWAAPSPAEPLDVIAPRGSGPILYHAVRLSQGLSGLDDRAAVSAVAGSGALTFDGARRERTFPGDAEAREYGGFTMTQGRRGITVGTGDVEVTEVDGAALPGRGIFYVVPGTGIVELRAEDGVGTPLGAGVFSADGEVLAIQSTLGAAGAGSLERSLTVAIRQPDGEAPPMGGAYQMVHYVAWLAGADEGVGANVGNGVGTGTLALSGDDGVVVAAGTLGRRVALDLDAAAGGADAVALVADADSASTPGTFSVASNGALRLDLVLEGPDGEARTLSGAGAVTSDGTFAALATSIASDDGITAGRGILFLVRIAQ